MSDENENTVPLGSFEPKCPTCGGTLKAASQPLTDETRIECPTHGDVGSFAEIKKLAVEQNRTEINARALEIARGMIRDTFSKK